ncbi:MAG TPA: hypothetical protein VGG64_29750 [Pirellulales bacterium]|jgi:hypothetical protein
MSIGPTSPILDATGTLAQPKAAEVARAQQESSSHARQIDSHARSEAAAGIAAPDDEISVTDERDSDGRRPWEAPAPKDKGASASPPAPVAGKKDLGGALDLTA